MEHVLKPVSEISRDELKALWRSFSSECFRLETFPEYRVAGEKDLVDAYFAGEPVAPRSDSFWEGNVQAALARGGHFIRVHIMCQKVNPNLQICQ